MPTQSAATKATLAFDSPAEIAAVLVGLGWKLKETCVHSPGPAAWRIEGTRRRQRIVARADSQLGAWREAFRQASGAGR